MSTLPSGLSIPHFTSPSQITTPTSLLCRSTSFLCIAVSLYLNTYMPSLLSPPSLSFYTSQPSQIKVPGWFAFEPVHLLTPVIKVGGLNSSEHRRRENTCQEVGSKRHRMSKNASALRGISSECKRSLWYDPNIKSEVKRVEASLRREGGG